ncbi:MAG: sialate O-acetylesterase [Bacteroidota bacterium]|nr:sialate O-acetylesterase [Bacteroidota bacterium]
MIKIILSLCLSFAFSGAFSQNIPVEYIPVKNITGIQQEKGTLKVFILAGQSNAVGYNNIREFHGGKKNYRIAFRKRSHILFWPGSNARDGFANHWTRLQVGISDISDQPSFSKACFGPEIGFGETISEELPNEDIAIIKYAVGATGIARSKDYQDYIPALKGFDDKGKNWHPPVEAEEAGILYQNLITNIRDALASLKQKGRNFEISGFIWMQGEHEAGISRTMANDYGKLLTLFMNSVRHDLGVMNLPFVVGEINSHTWAFADIGRESQATACRNDPHSLLIKTTDLSRKGIGGLAHFDADSMLTLGDRFANGMLQLLGIKSAEVTSRLVIQ